MFCEKDKNRKRRKTASFVVINRIPPLTEQEKTERKKAAEQQVHDVFRKYIEESFRGESVVR